MTICDRCRKEANTNRVVKLAVLGTFSLKHIEDASERDNIGELCETCITFLRQAIAGWMAPVKPDREANR